MNLGWVSSSSDNDSKVNAPSSLSALIASMDVWINIGKTF
jgi:hypothetical protein